MFIVPVLKLLSPPREIFHPRRGSSAEQFSHEIACSRLFSFNKEHRLRIFLAEKSFRDFVVPRDEKQTRKLYQEKTNIGPFLLPRFPLHRCNPPTGIEPTRWSSLKLSCPASWDRVIFVSGRPARQRGAPEVQLRDNFLREFPPPPNAMRSSIIHFGSIGSSERYCD